MPTYEGVKYHPKRATKAQQETILQYRKNKEEAKKLYEENDRLLEILEKTTRDEAIVYKENGIYRTIILGEPKGTYIKFSSLGFVHDAKTTKIDLNEMNKEK